VETIDEFVRRTSRPLIPYLEGSYPWAYAHHYLRMERESLPAPVRFGEEPMSMADAVRVVGWWCGMTGEDIDGAVRALADAYLHRWGIQRAVAPVPAVGSVAAIAAVPAGVPTPAVAPVPAADAHFRPPVTTKASLLAKARRLGIAGRSNMSKAELEEAIRLREPAA
jgi:hypothetical protein